MKAVSTIRIRLANELMNDVMDELTAAIWLKLRASICPSLSQIN